MKLSVITINYNNHDGLRKTIKSVVNQTFKDFEYIIIDGGSTDGGVDVIKKYADKIDYWVSEPDKGIYNAMNKGIDIAKGEYCIFMNSGDCFHDNQTLSLSIPHLDGIDVIAGYAKLDSGERVDRPIEITLQSLYNHQQPCHQSSFIRTILLKKYHYDEKYKLVSDWKFFIQVFVYGDSSYKPIDVVVSVYDSVGLSSVNRQLIDSEHVSILEHDFPKRVYDYYLYNTSSYLGKLYNAVRRSRCNKMFETIIKGMYKIFKFLFIR